MSNASTNLILRNDTILGVCEAIGQDFGFHPNWLRLTLACLFYWFPLVVVGGYLALGMIVFLSRWLAPDGAQSAGSQLVTVTSAKADREEAMAIAA